MSKKAKTAAKVFISDQKKIQQVVLTMMSKISEIVGSTMGPAGRNVLIESDIPGIPNKNTKDGVTVFNSLGANNSFEHVIIEQARDAAKRTATEAGDGTTTATILSAAMITNLYEYSNNNPSFSPQKLARDMASTVRNKLVPLIREKAIKISLENENLDLLKKVARISANGDDDMAEAVMKAFELLGYGENSHVTIKEVSGPYGYDVSLIEGFPIPIGYEESAGKFNQAFVNDPGNQRITLEKPKFLLFDGHISDLLTINKAFEEIGTRYANGDVDWKNLVIFAHGYSESVLTALAFNFADPATINVVPMVTPKDMFQNAQTHFLHDLAAFTGSRVFGMKDQINKLTAEDLGEGMQNFECYRFRCTIVGDPNPINIEFRAEELTTQKNNPESRAELNWLNDRIGKLTSGIVKLTIFGGSNGELKEAHDRCEDAVCAVRAAISKGALPGGCRTLLDLFLEVEKRIDIPTHVKMVLMPSLLEPIRRILNNAGHTEDSAKEIVTNLISNPQMIYDVENQTYGTAEELGVYDCLPAVEEAIKNAASIATVMGTLGGIVAEPRDHEFERQESQADAEFRRMVENPHAYANEGNERI